MNKSFASLIICLSMPLLAQAQIKNIYEVSNDQQAVEYVNSLTSLTEMNSYGDTPLVQAVKSNNLKIVELLLQKGADVNVKDSNGNTPLIIATQDYNMMGHHSSRYGENLKVIIALVKKGADINARDEKGRTPLILMSDRANVAFTKFLVAHGAKVNLKDNDNNTALSRMIGTHGQIYTAEDFAAMDVLIKNGANINATTGRWDTTVLHNAIQLVYEKSNRIELAKFLLERGADVNARTKHGVTPLMLASAAYASSSLSFFKQNPRMIQLLLDYKANVNLRDDEGYSALMHSVTATIQSPLVVQMLIDAGADVNASNRLGNQVIHVASSNTDGTEGVRILRMLIAAGADVNARGFLQESTLSMTDRGYGNPGMAKVLVENGFGASEEISQKDVSMLMKVKQFFNLN